MRPIFKLASQALWCQGAWESKKGGGLVAFGWFC